MPDDRGPSVRSRGKALLLIGIAVLGAAALGASTQPWVSVRLAEGSAASAVLEVTGQQVNASLSPIAIAAIAAALVLTIAGRWLRVGLGLLTVLLGAGMVGIAASVWGDVRGAARGSIAEVTGLSGHAQSDLVVAVETSPMVLLVVIVGAIIALLGVLVLVVGRRWATGGRRYQSRAASPIADGVVSRDRIADWDELSGGHDPTGADAPEGDQPTSESPDPRETR